jgi:hypothetical protein
MQMREVFAASDFSSEEFPNVQNIVSVQRWQAEEQDVPVKILSRGKYNNKGVWYYQVEWQGTPNTTWQTKKDLGVYDYLAYQYDTWCRIHG